MRTGKAIPLGCVCQIIIVLAFPTTAGSVDLDDVIALRCPDAEALPAALASDRGSEGAHSAAIGAVRCAVARLRKHNGLAPLRWNARLAAPAHRLAHDMVRRRYFSHVTPEGAELQDRLRASGYVPREGRWWIGEVLAWGTGPSSRPADVVARWLQSSPHRQIIFAPHAREVGIGMAFGAPVGDMPPEQSVTFAMQFGRTWPRLIPSGGRSSDQ